MYIRPISMSHINLASQKQEYSALKNNTNNIKSLNQDSITFSGKSDIPADSIKLLEKILPNETRLKNLSDITLEELRHEVNALQQTGLKMFDEIDKVKSDSSKLLPKDPNDIESNLCDFRTREADYYIFGDKEVLIKKYTNRKGSQVDFTIFNINPQTRKFTQIVSTDKQFPNIEGKHFINIQFDQNGNADNVNINFSKEYQL